MELKDLQSGLQLRDISIRRFRSLFQVERVPVQHDLTVVAGQNDGGKSTFLDAIAFLLGEKSLDDRDICNGATEEEGIEVEGVFDPMSDGDDPKPVIVRACRARGGKRIAELQALVHQSLGAPPEDLGLADLKKACSRVIPGGINGNSKQPFVDALTDWIGEQPASDFIPVWIPLPKQVAELLPKLQVFSSTTANDPVSSIQQLVRTQSQILLQSEKYSPRLAEIDKELVAELSESLQFVEERIQVHCEDLDGVEILPTYDFSKVSPSTGVQFHRNGYPIDYSKVGEGRQRKTTIAVYEADLDALRTGHQSVSHILVYDEPDSHLDYASQKRIGRLLEEQAVLPHVQVVVATHSRSLIDYAPLESVLSFSLDEELRTSATSLSSTEHEAELDFQTEMYASLGLSNSTLLDDRVFLLLEGPTEVHTFPILYRIVNRKSLVASGIQIIDFGGSGATNVFVDRLRNSWHKTVVAVMDEDARRKYESKLNTLGLTEGVDLFYIGSKEFEDCFSDEIWVDTLNRDYPMKNGKSWKNADLIGLRNSPKFSRALHQKVGQCIGDVDISKVDIGRSVAITCREKGVVPKQLMVCLQQLEVIAQQTTESISIMG